MPRHHQSRLWVRALEQRIAPARYEVDRLDSDPTAISFDPNDPSKGSLAYCIKQANEVPGCDDVIIINMGTIALLSSITISDEINIDPYGASESIIDFSKAGQAFMIDDCNVATSMHVSFTNLTFSGGASAKGGAIFAANEDVTVDGCFITGNKATTGPGGGIYFAGGAGSKLTILNTTISGNTSNGPGGGIYVKGDAAVIIANSTISGNTSGSSGGGIAIVGNGTLDVRNSTLTTNKSTGGLGGGIARLSGSATVTLTSAIVAQNSAVFGPDLGFNTLATVNANNSLVGVDDQGNFNLVGTGIQSGKLGLPLNAKLSPLADNGGQMPTHSPMTGSPAIDLGSNTFGLTTDQRGIGFARDIGKTDVGAIEFTTIPYAKSQRFDVSTAGGTTFNVNVTYTDFAGGSILAASIDTTDIFVSSPNGAILNPVSVMVSPPGDGSPRLAIYTFSSPGGAWDATDNGTYTATLKAGAVSDLDAIPNTVPGQSLGDFRVLIPSNRIVNATNDEVIDMDGKLSLREAIQSGLGSTITFDPTVFAIPQTIKLIFGELVISSPVTIVGSTAGVVIDAQDASRIFKVDGVGSNMNVLFRGLTLVNGFSTASGGGGAILMQDEKVNLFNCAISKCKASSNGGAIAGTTGTVMLDTCTIADNSAGVSGGGIYLIGGSAKVSVKNSTISGNVAISQGAGIYSQFMNQPDAVIVSNCTISGNIANRGGGIFLRDFSGGAQILNSTITANKSIAPMGSGDSRGGGLFASGFGSTFVMQSTILAGNFGADGKPDWNHDVGNQTVTGNDNIVGADDSNDNFMFSPGSTGNQTGTAGTPFDPLINLLANNGGPTQTHSLKTGSPAINLGNTDVGGIVFDQRGPGFFRVRGGRADVGAFELQTTGPPVVSSLIINNGNVQRSLVTTIRVTFSQAVSFTPNATAAFSLTRQSDGAAVTLNAIPDMSNTFVTLTFTGGAVDFISLADGRYTLRAFSSSIFNGNGRLDGDGTGFGSNCDDYIHVGTTDPGPKLFRLFGDSNGDAKVNSVDFAAFRSFFGLPGPSPFDFDNDLVTGSSDFNEFRKRFGLMI